MREDAELVDLALERLLAITWKTDWDRMWSAHALLREYFRRIALWHDILSPRETLYLHVYDLSSAVAPMPEMVKEKIDSVWEVHLEERRRASLDMQTVKLSRTERRRLHGRLIEATGHSGVGAQADRDVQKYLYWCGVLNWLQVQVVNLPCPYEPVIRLYERGGDYHLHHHEWQVMGVSFPRQSGDQCKMYPPLLALDDASLDEIDVAKL